MLKNLARLWRRPVHLLTTEREQLRLWEQRELALLRKEMTARGAVSGRLSCTVRMDFIFTVFLRYNRLVEWMDSAGGRVLWREAR